MPLGERGIVLHRSGHTAYVFLQGRAVKLAHIGNEIDIVAGVEGGENDGHLILRREVGVEGEVGQQNSFLIYPYVEVADCVEIVGAERGPCRGIAEFEGKLHPHPAGKPFRPLQGSPRAGNACKKDCRKKKGRCFHGYRVWVISLPGCQGWMLMPMVAVASVTGVPGSELPRLLRVRDTS